ncbi:betaine/proline/choline family ABC transporter ATP-binding protein [Rhizobium sp. KVB221]|uniref:Quaternary amine transport ATP-binding protein n=2 Tax=Rhizobium setariae TaxID=2801340 RepID=A0A937CLM1_9HYPH|nr:betaine/proline/choline family ABC transporter ATP-binding protein [Rhizobium setariae]MBL0373340.1 betaine/proline/choline family ABC transporter ATP-binding protein [Rhizobium setariae]
MNLKPDAPAVIPEPAVKCRNIWKVFGNASKIAMIRNAVINGELGRDEARGRYGCLVAVEDANFEVRRGEIFCIMGLSGSGKSTLLRHVNRLIEPTSGDVIVEGQSVPSLGKSALREMRARTIGMVFQNVALLPHRTVEQNTRLSLELRGESHETSRAAAFKALETVGLSGWEERYPRELSGGMQQRVGLARALAADVNILLMDEPFSALDPLIRKQLQDEFRRLVRTLGKTALFVTHDLDEAIRIGDRIAIMRDGKIVQTGTPAEIVLNPANDYVAQFVGGISPVHLVTAEKVMIPMAQHLAESGNGTVEQQIGTLPVVATSANLTHLIDLQIETGSPIAVEQDGVIVGIVGTKEILRAVQGKRES